MRLVEYHPENLNRFRHVISQSGRGLTIDRYVYNQGGHGIGSFFSKLFSMAAPVARNVVKQAINTGTSILKPHVKNIGKQALAVGTQIASDKVEELSSKIQSNLARAGSRKRPPTSTRKSKKRKDLFSQKNGQIRKKR